MSEKKIAPRAAFEMQKRNAQSRGIGWELTFEQWWEIWELFIWPQPDYGDIHVTVRKELPEYLTVGDEVSLPREYEGAIRSNLAVLLCAMHGSPLRPDIQAMAVNSKRAIKRNNSAIPMAKLPPGLLPNGRYNIYGDMVY
ncbi:hypothetical protein [Cupriavidus gilardii]|uniref:hypothetical protein n=1 Tax=Cupriavidus gilardii TaxID=82541 RepID=UPI002B290FE8|nr:hypothetical protein QWJ31_16630 [Cupriavidus gilardii]